MPADPRKVTEFRKTDREAITDTALRQVKALEDIADVLEAIRQDFVGLTVFLGRVIK